VGPLDDGITTTVAVGGEGVVDLVTVRSVLVHTTQTAHEARQV